MSFQEVEEERRVSGRGLNHTGALQPCCCVYRACANLQLLPYSSKVEQTVNNCRVEGSIPSWVTGKPKGQGSTPSAGRQSASPPRGESSAPEAPQQRTCGACHALSAVAQRAPGSTMKCVEAFGRGVPNSDNTSIHWRRSREASVTVWQAWGGFGLFKTTRK